MDIGLKCKNCYKHKYCFDCVHQGEYIDDDGQVEGRDCFRPDDMTCLCLYCGSIIFQKGKDKYVGV